MNFKSALFSALLLASLLLGACAPTITVPINPPEINITIVPGGGSSSSAAPAPAPEGGNGNGPSNITLLIYAVLVLAGIAFLMALFAMMRRPDS